MVVIFAPATAATGVAQERVGLAVEQHGAGAALAFAAAVLGAGQVEAIAQDGEKRLVFGSGDGKTRAVDVQNIIRHGEPPHGAGTINAYQQDNAAGSERDSSFLHA